MAALNLAGKTSGYIKLKSPDVALNATVELPNKDGILATLDDIGTCCGCSVETVNAPAFSVHIGNTPQSIPSTSWVQVNLDDVKFDSHMLLILQTVDSLQLLLGIIKLQLMPIL